MKKRPRVIYISTPLVPKVDWAQSFDFFSLLLVKIIDELGKRGIDVDVRVAKKEVDDKRSNQVQIFEEVTKDAKSYRAIIISPFSISELMKPVEQYLSKLATDSTLPQIFTIDKTFPDLVGRFDGPRGVQCNTREGGRAAAHAFIKHFKSEKIDSSAWSAYILQGLEGSDERIEGFLDGWKDEGGSESAVRISVPLEFTRSSASNHIEDLLSEELDDVRKGQRSSLRYPAIFACNDEMALGVYDVVDTTYRRALTDLLSSTVRLVSFQRDHDDPQVSARILKALSAVRIIGFDGISDIEKLIRNSDPGAPERFLLGTINVVIDKQTESLVNMIDEVLHAKGAVARERIVEAKPKMVTRQHRRKDTVIRA